MLEMLLLGLPICSTLTGLLTEGIKKLCEEHNRTYHSNTLAGIAAAVISLLVGIGYVLYTGTPITAQIICSVIALILLSWLCAMVGYDKVIQTISQFKTYGKDE